MNSSHAPNPLVGEEKPIYVGSRNTDAMASPSHIEFLGITGSGKSTLARTAVRTIPDARIAKEAYLDSVLAGPISRVRPLLSRAPGRIKRNVIRAYPRLRNEPVYAYHDLSTEHPDFAETVERIIKRIGVDEDERVRRLLIRRAVRYGVLMNEDVPMVFDEGFAMGAVTLFTRRGGTLEEPLIRQYMDAVPWPQILIQVDVDPEEGYQRAQSRPDGLPSSIARLPERVRRERFEDMARCVTIIGDLAERRGTNVVRVDNTEALSATKRTLSEEVDALIRST